MEQAKSPVVADFLRDAFSFVQSSREAIDFSTAHIYISALPFAPKESLVYRTFSPLFKGLVSVTVSGTDRSADCTLTVATISLDGHVVVSASSDGSVQMWKAGENDTTRLDCEGQVLSMVISADGQMIAAGSSDNAVRIWEVAHGQAVPPDQQMHQGPVQAVAFSPDATRLASGSIDQTVYVWKVRKVPKTLLQRFQSKVGQILALPWSSVGANSPVSAAAYSADGSHIAFGYDSGTVQIVQATTGTTSRSIPCDDHNAIKSLVFSPDGKFIWMSSGNDIIRVDVEKKSERLVVTGHTGQVNVVTCSANGQLVASGADDATIRLWNAKTGDSSGPELRDHDGPVISVVFSADGRSLFSAGTDGTVREWNLAQARVPLQDEQTLLTRLDGQSYKQDSGWLVDSSSPSRRRLWIPTEHRDALDKSINSRVIFAQSAHKWLILNGSDLCYGERWAKCWIGGK